jgi:hypothetical protein
MAVNRNPISTLHKKSQKSNVQQSNIVMSREFPAFLKNLILILIIYPKKEQNWFLYNVLERRFFICLKKFERKEKSKKQN